MSYIEYLITNSLSPTPRTVEEYQPKAYVNSGFRIWGSGFLEFRV